ncbi:RNA-binding protein 33 isoform X2 [Bombina bombina]|uniref:RNA-binding protein 33 isoform X2 n=1 Tax=Bombina bombina TaxID=8345 RepID=UPI00235B0899|nr:RNA-binding protein 33 isoform X2 [Bombina bombina]
MSAMLGDEEFDQLDKPGAERSRRRRTEDDWDSELEDDLLEEDFLPGKKNASDLSDEELNDDLLQSDEEEPEHQNYSGQDVTVSLMAKAECPFNCGQDVTVSLNATAEAMSSFDLSKSINEASVAEDEEAEYEEEETEAIYEEVEEDETGAEDFAETYEENDAELTEEPIDYADDEPVDEVLDIEINEPLDEFQDEEYIQTYKRQNVKNEIQQYTEEEMEESEVPDALTNSEELHAEAQDLQPETREESDEEDDEDEEGGRIRFKTERKEGTIIRLYDASRERRNIPETLELSDEAKESLLQFEEMERQRRQGRYGSRRGGRRGGNNGMPRGMGGQRNENDRRNMRDQRQCQGQPIRSLFQQHQQMQQIQPLLPTQRSRNSSKDGMSTSQQEKQRSGGLLATPQSKNIHINPHFKGNVTPVQGGDTAGKNSYFRCQNKVPLLPVPNQPRPVLGQHRYPGMPEFQHVPVQGNFNPPPRLQEPWRNTPPPQQPDREPFFMGEPRFPNHHMFDQRNPPPGPPPPLLSSNHPVPNQNTLPYNQHGQGFNQPGPQPRFNQQGPPPNFNQPGPQPGFNQPGPGPQQAFNQPGPQTGFNQPGFNQPGFNQAGPQPPFTQPGPQPGFNQPGFNPPGPQPGFNQPGPQPGFNQPGLNQPGFNQPGSGPQPRFNQPGPGPQPGFPPPGPAPQPGFNQPGFSRERPVRMNMPSPGPMGIPPFNQNSSNMRHFAPPRPPFPPTHGQPFISHSQPNMQCPPPMQPLQQHHHVAGPPKSPQQPFRPHIQKPQTPNNRIQGQQRQGQHKPRQGTPVQMISNQQTTHARNSNLRELPIAPSHTLDVNKRRQRTAAQIKPIATTTPQARPIAVTNAQSMNLTSPVKEEVKLEQFPGEDEETRKYRLKIEEQKRLREEILKQKELRRQQQAGARKKELLERLSQQQQQQPTTTQQSHPEPEKQPLQVANNGNPILPHISLQTRLNVKNRLFSQIPETLTTISPAIIPPVQQAAGTNTPVQGKQKKIVKQTVQNIATADNQLQKVQRVRPAGPIASITQVQTIQVASPQGRQQRAGAKRTVMQRSNSTSGDGPIITPKVRVIKLSGGGGDNVITSPEGNLQMQPPQQRLPQQRPPYPQRQPQKQGTIRKVTLAKGTVQQHQHQYLQHPMRPLPLQTESAIPKVVNTVKALHQPNKVIMRGRGRGVVGQMGRGRLMPNKQNLRVVECKPQPCVVSVEGLSSSTTDIQLKNLLMSVGPIQSFQMLPQLRKAVATFKEPLHALAFQQKFHRHMVDLSHINVSLVTD